MSNFHFCGNSHNPFVHLGWDLSQEPNLWHSQCSVGAPNKSTKQLLLAFSNTGLGTTLLPSWFNILNIEFLALLVLIFELNFFVFLSPNHNQLALLCCFISISFAWITCLKSRVRELTQCFKFTSLGLFLSASTLACKFTQAHLANLVVFPCVLAQFLIIHFTYFNLVESLYRGVPSKWV